MANKEALRQLQTRLAERLANAKAQPAGLSWLAVECGGRGLLFPLRDAGEIYAMAPMLPVPHTHRWFLGVSNLRGHLHGVVDLAAFLGVKAPDATRDQARLVGFNPGLQINCALLVDRLSGLRNEPQLTLENGNGNEGDADAPARPAFVGERYRDASGRLWQELRLAELSADDAFLRIVG